MRVSRWGLPVAILAMAAMAAPALADEVVHLKNGTYMSISSHAVDGEMLHVTLGSDAQMAFPLSMVDRIERGGKLVPLTADASTGGTVANRRVEGSTTGAGSAASAPQAAAPTGGVTGAATLPRSHRSQPASSSGRSQGPVGLVRFGDTTKPQPAPGNGVYRPRADSSSVARQRISAVGNRGMISARESYAGGGNRLSSGNAPSRKFEATTFSPKSSPEGQGEGSGKGE